MHKYCLAAACYLATALAVGSAWAQGEVVKLLEFDVDGVLPSADTEIALFTSGATATESQVYSVSSGLLQQRSLAPSGTYSYVFPDTTLSGGNLDPTKNVVIEWRLRILGIEGRNGAFFDAHDGLNRYSAFFLDTGQVRLSDSTLVPISNISQFHTYRIESLGNSSTYRFLVDGVLRATANTDLTGSNGFQWGDGLSSVGNGADADWDFVRVSQATALPQITQVLTSGPLRDDGLGGLEAFDINGDENDDLARIIHGAA